MRRFSATEKFIFGALMVIAVISALAMASRVNAYFMTEIPAYGGQLREGVVGLPRTINPVLAITDVDRDISALVYSGLMKYENGNLVPDLASSYAISPDGLTYTFTVRPGITFSDGSSLTADDVVFTIQKIQDIALKSPRRIDWLNVTATASSTNQVVFTLKQPYSPFLSNMTVGIMPKHIWKSVSDDQFIFSEYNIEPIGTGPYRVTSISRDSGGIPTSYRLGSWSGYYGTMPHVSSILLDFYADADKALAALETGVVDSLPSVSADNAARLAGDTGESYAILSAPLPRVFGVFFNQNQNPVLADKNIRQALDMTVNRAALVSTVLDGYGSPLYGPLPAGFAGTDPTAAQNWNASTSIAAAQALVEKNGWKKDPATGIYEKKGAKNSLQTLSFSIYTADTPDLKQAAQMVEDSWNTFGARVDVKVFEPTDLYQNVIRTRKYDALLFGELIGKDRDLYAFWHSSERTAPGLNVALYTNSKVDKLLDDIRTTNDDNARNAKYAQLSSLISADIPAVFLYTPDFLYAVPKMLRGVALSDITVPADRWNSVESWYIATERVWRIFASK